MAKTTARNSAESLKRQSGKGFPSGLLFLAVSFFFSLVLLLPYLQGHWHLADDARYSGVTAFLLQARIMAEGMWPFWNPNIGFGQPWALNPASGVFYPPQALWGLLVGWNEQKYLWFILLHLAAGGYLAARFAQRLRLTDAGCVLFLLAFLGNGFAIGFISNKDLLVPWVFWPLLAEGFLQLEGEAQSSARAWAIRKIGLAFFLMETGGYPLTRLVVLGSTLAVWYLLSRKPGSWIQGPSWKAVGIALLGGALASAPELVTTFEAMGLSERFARSIYDDAVYHNVSNLLQFGTLLFPAQFLARDQFQLGSMQLERSWWIGVLPLALILVGIGRGLIDWRRLRIPWLVAFVGFLYALGGATFFREGVSALVPLFGKLRQSHLARAGVMALLCFMAAEALSNLERKPGTPPSSREPGDRKLAWLWGGFVVLCGIFAVIEADHPVHARDLWFEAATGWKVAVLHAYFWCLLAWTVYSRRIAAGPRAGWAWLIVAIAFLNLGETGYEYRKLVGQRSDEPLKRVEEPFTVASPQANARVVKNWFDGDDWYNWEGNTKVLNAYYPPDHRWYAAARDDAALKPLRSTLVSCTDDPRILAEAGVEPAGHGCAGLRAQIDRYWGNRIELSGTNPSASLVVIHDFQDPHWKAWVNGAEAPVRSAYRYFKAVETPAGSWKVRLEYRHPAFPALWFVAALGALLLAWAPGAGRPSSAHLRLRKPR